MHYSSHVLSERNSHNIPVGQVQLTPTGKAEFPNKLSDFSKHTQLTKKRAQI